MGAGASIEGADEFKAQCMTKVNDLYKALDKDGTNAVPRPEMWAGIHADAEMAELMGKAVGGDAAKGSAVLKAMQALRVLDTNFDGVITPDEFANLTKPEVIDQALAAVAAEASTAESLPYAAELAKAGVDAAAAAAWRALWKEIAGVERDFSAWDAAQWAAAGAEGGFDGAKVKGDLLPFLYVNMSEEDGGRLRAMGASFGLAEAEAAALVHFLVRTVCTVTDAFAAAENEAKAGAVVKSIEAAVGGPLAGYVPPLKAAAFAAAAAAAVASPAATAAEAAAEAVAPAADAAAPAADAAETASPAAEDAAPAAEAAAAPAAEAAAVAAEAPAE